MPENKVIEELVTRYLDFWRASDIDGLMSMYHPDVSYHDIATGDVADYSQVRILLTDSLAPEKNLRVKLKELIYVENSSALINCQLTFSMANSNKKVDVNGVELIVFSNEKVISVHEFYDYQVAANEDDHSSPGTANVDKLTKLGLTETQVATIATEIKEYFDSEKPFLEPDLNLHSMSEKMGYTRNQISYVINHVLGRTFYDLVNGRRIEHVIQQMSSNHSRQSILEIAINAGFNSVSGFYSAFKKSKGMTPAQYQRSLKTR